MPAAVALSRLVQLGSAVARITASAPCLTAVVLDAGLTTACGRVATLLDIPLEDVPDPQIDACLAAGMSPEDVNQHSKAELNAYLLGHGYRLTFHKRAPVHRDALDRDLPGSWAVRDHTVVMSYGQIVLRASRCPRG
jgi:hypothetical protein